MTAIKGPILTDDHFETNPPQPFEGISVHDLLGRVIEAGWDQVGPDGVAVSVKQTETDDGWVHLFTPRWSAAPWSSGPRYWPPRKAKGYRKHVRRMKSKERK